MVKYALEIDKKGEGNKEKLQVHQSIKSKSIFFSFNYNNSKMLPQTFFFFFFFFFFVVTTPIFINTLNCQKNKILGCQSCPDIIIRSTGLSCLCCDCMLILTTSTHLQRNMDFSFIGLVQMISTPPPLEGNFFSYLKKTEFQICLDKLSGIPW